jgi:hypothetical protein
MLEHGRTSEPPSEDILRTIIAKRKDRFRSGELPRGIKSSTQEVARVGYEQFTLQKRREAAMEGEQRPEDIDEIREGIKAIYESPEVKDALYDKWTRTKGHISGISLRKGSFRFTLYPGMYDTSEGIAPLTISRTEVDSSGRVIPDSVWMIDASSRDVIGGTGVFKGMEMYCEFNLSGPESIAVGKELIRSYNNPKPQES